jgi:hypothetical protein
VSIAPADGSAEPAHSDAKEVAARAANSNTAPSPRSDAATPPAARRRAVVAEDSAKVIALPGVKPLPQGVLATVAASAPSQPPVESVPAPAGSPGSIDVVLSRETATFTVPVSEAALPHALARMMGGRIVAAQALAVEDRLEPTVPEPAPMAIAAPDDDLGDDVTEPDLSPEDMTLARRFAPPAAE